MARPKGLPKTGGRAKGSTNKATAAKEAAIAASGLTPLEFMLSALRDEGKDFLTRFEAAKHAAPYVHPKLASVDNTLKGPDGGPVRHEIEMHIVDPKAHDEPEDTEG
jgi:hypothetical protein